MGSCACSPQPPVWNKCWNWKKKGGQLPRTHLLCAEPFRIKFIFLGFITEITHLHFPLLGFSALPRGKVFLWREVKQRLPGNKNRETGALHWELLWRSSCKKGRRKANCGMRQKECCFHLSHCQSLFVFYEVMRTRAKGMFYNKNKIECEVLTLTLVPRLVWAITYWICGAILQWEHQLSGSMHLQPYLLYHFALELDR